MRAMPKKSTNTARLVNFRSFRFFISPLILLLPIQKHKTTLQAVLCFLVGRLSPCLACFLALGNGLRKNANGISTRFFFLFANASVNTRIAEKYEALLLHKIFLSCILKLAVNIRYYEPRNQFTF